MEESSKKEINLLYLAAKLYICSHVILFGFYITGWLWYAFLLTGGPVPVDFNRYNELIAEFVWINISFVLLIISSIYILKMKFNRRCSY